MTNIDDLFAVLEPDKPEPPKPPEPEPKKRTRKPRDRKKEYAERTEAQRLFYENNRKRKKLIDKGVLPPPTPVDLDHADELRALELRTKNIPTDADGDIDFAYRNMALAHMTPLMAPSISAWSWYLYARSESKKFLEICAKREDAKAKIAGTITNQRMEDDKRQQFAVIDKMEKSLALDVKAIVTELMEKFPMDVLEVCWTFESEWQEFMRIVEKR